MENAPPVTSPRGANAPTLLANEHQALRANRDAHRTSLNLNAMPDSARAYARPQLPAPRSATLFAACLAAFAVMASPLQRTAAAQPRSFSTPPSGDTLGYWQQQVRYRIVATLD